MAKKPDSEVNCSVIAPIVDTLLRMIFSQEIQLWVKVKHSPSYLSNNLSAIQSNRKRSQASEKGRRGESSCVLHVVGFLGTISNRKNIPLIKSMCLNQDWHKNPYKFKFYMINLGKTALGFFIVLQETSIST